MVPSAIASSSHILSLLLAFLWLFRVGFLPVHQLHDLDLGWIYLRNEIVKSAMLSFFQQPHRFSYGTLSICP
uniref:Uncharacterized protein n=1 Tax=Arundo donax TaxID=35708 RepID=A0A0A8XX15_ARUDO